MSMSRANNLANLLTFPLPSSPPPPPISHLDMINLTSLLRSFSLLRYIVYQILVIVVLALHPHTHKTK